MYVSLSLPPVLSRGWAFVSTGSIMLLIAFVLFLLLPSGQFFTVATLIDCLQLTCASTILLSL